MRAFQKTLPQSPQGIWRKNLKNSVVSVVGKLLATLFATACFLVLT